MTPIKTKRFRQAFRRLPKYIQQQEKAAYRLFAENPCQSGLDFKKIHSSDFVYSVHIGLHDRAVGVRSSDVILWVWIGSHSEYDKLIRQIRG